MGKLYFSVIEAAPTEDYRLFLTFATGERKVYDMKPLLDEVHDDWHVYMPLKDIDFFMSARTDGTTVFWGNGDIDIAPEELYENSTPL